MLYFDIGILNHSNSNSYVKAILFTGMKLILVLIRHII